MKNLGHKCLTDLPTLNDEGFAKMYKAIDLWLEGNPVDELLGVPGSTYCNKPCFSKDSSRVNM